MQLPTFKRALLLCLLAATSALATPHMVAADEEYAFTVHNKSKLKITQVLVSEDKKTWNKFDVSGGIAAGATVKLVWDKSTNSQECKQWVKAVYAGGEEATAAKFDFCEKDLEIEFED